MPAPSSWRVISTSMGGLIESAQASDRMRSKAFICARDMPCTVAIVGDTAHQHAAAGVGEGGEFIGQVVAARADGAIATELDLLELPAAVLAEAELAPDVVRTDGHQSSSREPDSRSGSSHNP